MCDGVSSRSSWNSCKEKVSAGGMSLGRLDVRKVFIVDALNVVSVSFQTVILSAYINIKLSPNHNLTSARPPSFSFCTLPKRLRS